MTGLELSPRAVSEIYDEPFVAWTLRTAGVHLHPGREAATVQLAEQAIHFGFPAWRAHPRGRLGVRRPGPIPGETLRGDRHLSRHEPADAQGASLLSRGRGAYAPLFPGLPEDRAGRLRGLGAATGLDGA